MRIAPIAVSLALGLIACGPSGGTGVPPELADALADIGKSHPDAGRRRVVLVALDGCDPAILEQLVRQGKLPTFARLRREGARGQLECPAPLDAMSTWTTLATGVPPEVHGILASGKEEAEGVSPVTAADRRAPAIWELASAAGLRTAVVGWPLGWRGGPVPADGVAVAGTWDPLSDAAPTDWWPASYAAAVEKARVAPADITDHLLRTYVDADPSALATAAEPGGPADAIRRALARAESVRNLCVDLLRKDPPRLLACRMGAIAEISRPLMRYAPPRLREVPLESFRQYRSAIEAVYGWHDRFLAELLSLVDEDTTVFVVSPHGFRSGDAREKRLTAGEGADSAAWHRPWGTFLVWGGGAAPGAQVHEARSTAVAPTVLAALGLPRPEAMESRVLDVAFDVGLPAVSVPAYPEIPTGTVPPGTAEGLDPDAPRRGLVERMMEKGEYAQVAAMLSTLVAAAPEPWLYFQLARARIEQGRAAAVAGRPEDAQKLAGGARDAAARGLTLAPDDAEGHCVMAEVLVVYRELDQALEHARTATRLRPRHERPQNVLARVHRGRVLIALQKGDRAAATRQRHAVIAAYERSLDIEPRQMDALVRSAEQRLLLTGSPQEQERRAQHAISDLELAVDIRPADRDALNRLAVAFLRRGELAMGGNRVEEGELMLKNALKTVTRALAAESEYAAAWANKAYITYALWLGSQTAGDGFPKQDEAVAMDLWEQCNEAWARAEALQPGYPFNTAWIIRRTNSEYALKGKPLPVPPPKDARDR